MALSSFSLFLSTVVYAFAGVFLELFADVNARSMASLYRVVKDWLLIFGALTFWSGWNLRRSVEIEISDLS